MSVTERLPIKINRSQKELVVRNNRTLKRFIQSGAALALFPVWECLRAAAETVDPLLTNLTRLLEAVMLYYSRGYSLVHEVTLRGAATGRLTRSGRVLVAAFAAQRNGRALVTTLAAKTAQRNGRALVTTLAAKKCGD
jgi:hypothetical protein